MIIEIDSLHWIDLGLINIVYLDSSCQKFWSTIQQMPISSVIDFRRMTLLQGLDAMRNSYIGQQLWMIRCEPITRYISLLFKQFIGFTNLCASTIWNDIIISIYSYKHCNIIGKY